EGAHEVIDGLFERDRRGTYLALDPKPTLRDEPIDEVFCAEVILERRIGANYRKHVLANVGPRMFVLRVDDREARARREQRAEAWQHDVEVHPVQARAAGDEAIRGIERRVLRASA